MAYTEEDLNNIGRVELRRRAFALGMPNKDCTNKTSDQLKEFILSKQDGGEDEPEEKKEKPASRSRGKSTTKSSAKGNGKSTTKKSKEAPAEDVGASSEKIDHLGAALDETTEKLSGKLDEVLQGQDAIMRQQFILFGLQSDLYKGTFEPDEFDERLKELEEEWDSSGN